MIMINYVQRYLHQGITDCQSTNTTRLIINWLIDWWLNDWWIGWLMDRLHSTPCVNYVDLWFDKKWRVVWCGVKRYTTRLPTTSSCRRSCWRRRARWKQRWVIASATSCWRRTTTSSSSCCLALTSFTRPTTTVSSSILTLSTRRTFGDKCRRWRHHVEVTLVQWGWREACAAGLHCLTSSR